MLRFARYFLEVPPNLHQLPYRAGYARMRRGNNHLDDRMTIDFSDPNSHQHLEDLEDMNEYISQNRKYIIQDINRDEKVHQKKLLRAIIKKKYFKEPQETNLLTWDAKEQIKYLHQEYPSEWSVERLAESFPISRDGIRKLLKSKFYPRTVEEVIKHDRKVHANWQALNPGSPKQLSAGPIQTRYEALIKAGKVDTLKNAAGIQTLPHSDWQQRLLEAYSRPKKPPGLFESIVKDYCEQKKMREDLQSRVVNHRDLLAEMERENFTLLGAVTKSVLPKDLNPVELIEDGNNKKHIVVETGAMKEDMMGAFDYQDTNVRLGGNQESITDRIDPDSTGFLDNPEAEERQWSGRKLREKRHRNLNEGDLQMSGTGKLTYSHNEVTEGHSSNPSEPNEEFTTKNSEESRISHELKQRKKVLESLRYDEYSESTRSEAYIYDERQGYQYPYGKREHFSERINVPKEHRNQNASFKRGKIYYDSDGEFLYKIP